MSGAVPCGLVQKNRNSASVRSIASVRVIHPRSTPTGYAASAKPTAAMLAGAPGCVLSATRPFAALVSFRKYANA